MQLQQEGKEEDGPSKRREKQQNEKKKELDRARFAEYSASVHCIASVLFYFFTILSN